MDYLIMNLVRRQVMYSCSGTIFGAIHCCGWFFVFLTAQELLPWRIASVLTSSLPMGMVGVMFWAAERDGLEYIISMMAFFILLVFYIIARLFNLVGVFRSLFYLPIYAFIYNIPHLS
jgi:hypothetical protein